MNILNPPIFKIGKRFYRQNPISMEEASAPPPIDELENDYDEYLPEEKQQEEANDTNECSIDSTEDSNSILTKLPNEAGYQLQLSIPDMFYGSIIGQRGDNLRRLETETKCKVRIPQQKSQKTKQETKDTFVVITGPQLNYVQSAHHRINVIVQLAREKLSFTHFLSIPLTQSDLQTRLKVFQEEILKSCKGDRGIEPSIFISPSSLHLTLCMLLLASADERQKTEQIIQKCGEKWWTETSEMRIHLRGLEYMNDDPSAVDVLYIRIDETTETAQKLQKFANELMNELVKCGLSRRQGVAGEQVKLHVTVMNSAYRNNPTDGAVDSGKYEKVPRKSFNATQVMKKFHDFDFGEICLGQVHVSIRYSSSTNGYFTPAYVWTPKIKQ